MCSVGASDGLRQETLTFLPASESIFATHFCKELDENVWWSTELEYFYVPVLMRPIWPINVCFQLLFFELQTDSRTVNAFEGELSYLGRCNRRKMKPNRKVLQKGRARTGSSTRQSPFQCPTKLSIDIDKHIHLNGDQNSGHCSTQSPCHSEENFFGSFSK